MTNPEPFDGGPAFPVPIDIEGALHGMSLRDYFAQGALAFLRGGVASVVQVAEQAYDIADAMIVERARRARLEEKLGPHKLTLEERADFHKELEA